MWADKPEAVHVLVARGVLIRDGRAANAGAVSSSIAALKALMTSPQWLAMSRTERIQAERLLLHIAADKPTLDAVRSLVLDMPLLLRYYTTEGGNPLHTAAKYGRPMQLLCALSKVWQTNATLMRSDQGGC